MQAQADSACSFIGTSNNGYNYRMEFSNGWILGLPTPPAYSGFFFTIPGSFAWILQEKKWGEGEFEGPRGQLDAH